MPTRVQTRTVCCRCAPAGSVESAVGGGGVELAVTALTLMYGQSQVYSPFEKQPETGIMAMSLEYSTQTRRLVWPEIGEIIIGTYDRPYHYYAR